MKLLIIATIMATLFISCTHTFFPATNGFKAKDVAINWGIDTAYVNGIYNNVIDSKVDSAINEFNKGKHAFKLHEALGKDSNVLSFNFSKSRFVSDGDVALGYIISGLGIIGSPIITLTSSNSQFFLAFWYLPHDYINYTATLTSNQLKDSMVYQYYSIRSNALFNNKLDRVKNIADKLNASLIEILNEIDNNFAIDSKKRKSSRRRAF